MFARFLAITLQGLVLWLMAAPFALAPAGAARAQTGPPEIVEFRIRKQVEDGRTWLVFSWQARNVDRVRLFEEGREKQSRIQLSDGSFGWPARMPGAFRIGTGTGNFELVAQNAAGRVSARTRIDGSGCFALLDPPGRAWQRCKVGGLIAANLTPSPAPGPARCSGGGVVTSALGFSARYRDNPLLPNSSVSTVRLDTVWLVDRRSGRTTLLRLSGRGNSREYRFNGLQGGRDYLVALPNEWFGRPQWVEFRCPDRPGAHQVRLDRLHNTEYHHEY